MIVHISKSFNKVWHGGLLLKLKSVVLDGKFNAGVSHGSILGPTFFLLYINDLPDDVTCNIAIYVDDTTLYSKRDQASDLWQ